MRCCVRNCTNNVKMKKSSNCRLSFHLFPKDPKHRAAWIKALGFNDWAPTDRAVVCSNHFKEEDFYDTKKGVRRINFRAVPQIPEDLDAPAALRVCRICLTLDVKMYSIRSFKLNQMYEDITGILVTDNEMEGKLPPHVCWECAARLSAAAAFRAKALISDGLLHDILKSTQCIKIGDIKSVNREHKGLKSSLAVENLHEKEDDYRHVPVKTEAIHIPDNYRRETVFQNLITEISIKDEENNEMVIEEYDRFDNVAVKTEVDLVPTQVEITFENSNNNAFEGYVHFNEEYNGLGPSKFTEKKENTEAHIFHGDRVMVEDDDDDDDDDMDSIEVDKKNKNIEFPIYEDKEAKTEAMKVDDSKFQCIMVSNLQKNEIANINNNPDSAKKRVMEKPYGQSKQPLDENVITIIVLSHQQQIDEVLKRKESSKYKFSPFKCDVCYRGFPNEDKHTRHALKHSEKNGPYQCDICKTHLKARWALRGHMARQHTQEYSCKQCPFVTRSRHVALGHVKFHAGNKYNCQQCSMEFEKKTTLFNHMRLKHISDSVCELCGYTFVSKIGVNSHKRLKHQLVDKDIKLVGPYCKVCDVKFLSRKAYDRHMRLSSKHIESEDDPNRLSNDPTIKTRRVGSFRPKAVRRPVIRARDPDCDRLKPNEPVECEQCGSQLPTLHAYACHFKSVHPGINRTKFPSMVTPYMCEQCGKMFLNTTLLNSHMWVHTGEKCFQCDHCNKTFSQKANLAGHIMRQHDVAKRFYDCRVCGKQFTSPSNRSRHMFLHTGLKPFKCDACEKNFPTSGELRAHVDYVHLKKTRPKRVRRRPKKCDVPSLGY